MHIVIHYSEIGLKRGNRIFFEKKLTENIGKTLVRADNIYRRHGKVVVETGKSINIGITAKKLSFIPGISSFAFAEKTDLRAEAVEDIKKIALRKLSKQSFNTFRIKTIRSDKNFPRSSVEINAIVGNLIRKKLGKKVDLDNPDITLYIEISEKEAFLYTKKYRGVGGLPVGSSGKAVVLLSGGIDSPVASFFAMKRGIKVVFVHVLNKTMKGGRETTDKIKKIVEKLSVIQNDSKLYIVPFEKIQKTIIANVPAEYRMIVYRRFMLRIAQAVAGREKSKAIIVGDSVGQVASQTIDNLGCVYKSADLPVLPPLIGMNKEEIIEIAKRIGTYDFSILPYPDCCSFMIAKHPETKGDIKKVKMLEGLIKDKNNLVDRSVKKAGVELITNS